jgi:competence protein ComGC
MYRRLAIVALLVISVLLVLILVRSAQQRSCLVEVKGISPSNTLSTNQKHTVEVYGS